MASDMTDLRDKVATLIVPHIWHDPDSEIEVARATGLRLSDRILALPEIAERGWRDIESAPGTGYIIGAWRDGGHWRVADMFEESDEWVDVFSDRIHRPTHWIPRPPTA